MSNPRQEGREAQEKRLYCSDCPYARGTVEQKEWVAGWMGEETIVGHEAGRIVGEKAKAVRDSRRT